MPGINFWSLSVQACAHTPTHLQPPTTCECPGQCPPNLSSFEASQAFVTSEGLNDSLPGSIQMLLSGTHRSSRQTPSAESCPVYHSSGHTDTTRLGHTDRTRPPLYIHHSPGHTDIHLPSPSHTGHHSVTLSPYRFSSHD